jgi:hypothetical protein
MIRYHPTQPISGLCAGLLLASVLVAHDAATARPAHAGTFDYWIKMPGKTTDIAAGDDPAFQTEGNGGANGDLQVWVVGTWKVYAGVVEQALAGYTTYQTTCSGICNLLAITRGSRRRRWGYGWLSAVTPSRGS